jgi:CheY-like chemotaxis protein
MAAILIIDDERLVRGAMRLALERAGHQILEAENGCQGETLFAENKADLIIVDLIMPDQDGLRTIENIRSGDSDVPLIAMTGGGPSGPDSLLKQARAAGADRTLVKPVERADLLKTVHEALEALRY